MWVNSKVAAEILGVKYDTLQKATRRALNHHKKFCSIKFNMLYFNYITGRGGNSGKILQIWIDDANLSGGNSVSSNTVDGGDCLGGISLSNSQNLNLSESAASSTQLNLEPLETDKRALNLDDKANWLKDEKNSADFNPTSRDVLVGGESDLMSYGVPVRGRDVLQNSVPVRGGESDFGACGNSQNNIKNQKIKDLEKMNKIKAVNEMNAVPNGFGKTAWGKSIAQKYGVSLKTLYSWKKDLEELCQCDDKSGCEITAVTKIDFRATFKTSSFDIKALEWAVCAWMNRPLSSKTFVYESLEKEAFKNGWKIGSYKTFARLMDKPEIKAMLLRGIRGIRGVRNEIAPFVKRDLNLYNSMEMICGDQIVFDFDVVGEDGLVVNPNAYVWIDMGSGAIIGVDVVLGKYNKLSVGRSLKMALGFGVPDSIYTDNGKPELSNYVKEVISQLSGIKLMDYDELDPRLIHKKARPANSRAKPIENIFNHVQRWMMEDIIYEKGGSSYHKDNRKNGEILKKYMKDHPLFYKEFIGYFAKAIKKWNEHLNKSRNIVPIEKFIKGLDRVSTFDDTTLDYIFSQRRAIKVRNSSINLSINKTKYSFTSAALSKYNGEVVEVRLMDEELKSVSVVDMKSHRFICEAYENEAIDPRDSLLVKAKIAQNEEVVKAVNEAFNYYKGLYTKQIRLGSYSGIASEVKNKNEKRRKNEKNMKMNNDELIKALKAI